MFQYTVKRILIFIPTLLVISLIAFTLSKLAPGDPVELILKGGLGGEAGQAADKIAGERAYLEKAKELGLDLPVFYLSLSPAAYPDTLYQVAQKAQRENLSNLIGQYGNWQEIQAYYKSLKALELKQFEVQEDSTNYSARRKVKTNVKDLLVTEKDAKVTRLIEEMTQAVKGNASMALIGSSVQAVQQNYAALKSNATTYKKYIPAIHWYGSNNQYHYWITNFFKGDFGVSYSDNRPVSSKISDALKWTLIINIIAIFLAYLLSIPIGVFTALKKDSRFDRITTTILFILYSLPSFWIGTILIVFLTTPEYGTWLDWFPTGGITSDSISSDASFFTRWSDIGYHLILPVFCVTYGALAFISRQMRGGMLSVIRQDYIRTARAKGLDESTITWKHAFRNSLFPIITLFASIFPRAVGGSIAIEVIYGIPGMGQLLFQSILSRDWPIVFTVLMLVAILTMIGNLIADMLYAVADPRVSFK